MITDIIKILEFVTKNAESAFFYTPLINGNEISYLFKKSHESVICKNLNDLNKSLELIDEFSNKYDFAYGSIPYETGYFFEEKLKSLFKNNEGQFLSFYFFYKNEVEVIPTKNIDFRNINKLFNETNFVINKMGLNESQKEYEAKIERIKKYISKGDTYQVNYTLKAKFDYSGEVKKFIAQLIFKQSASYTSIINEKNNFIISVSPELFFKTEGDKIISKPMKGTIKRGNNYEKDSGQIKYLRNSEKDKAENIMIVDLLRNDFGKLSKYSSIKAEPLFEIEKYETLYQMTSTVTGELKNKSFAEIIKNLFPCGSITGAPKIRTMEIINELEKEKRGVYTGTIGIINKKDFIFNIPIRTITLSKLTNKGEIGLGSGVVWDSNPKTEFEEVKLKSEFLANPTNYFELIETMLIELGEIFLLENHISRLKKSAEYFIFYFDETKLRELLESIVTGLNPHLKFKLKLLLTKWGELKYNFEQIFEFKNFGRILISDKPIDSNNKFQYFKSTYRELYNSELKKWQKEGFDDVIFLNENGKVVEGAITNIMISNKNGFITPPIEDGLLNGCYREYLLSKENNIVEKSFDLSELLKAQKALIFNSVKKEILITDVVLEKDLN